MLTNAKMTDTTVMIAKTTWNRVQTVKLKGCEPNINMCSR